MARTIIFLVCCGLLSAARSAPTVVSINLCTDQLVLNVAHADQILSLSWLAADADESMLHELASPYARNFGTAEEIVRLAPDVVIAGSYSNPYTKSLLSRLGYEVVEIEPARSLRDIATNLLKIGDAIDRADEARAVVAAMQDRISVLAAAGSEIRPSAIVIRPGGYTIERDSIAHELLELAGIEDRAIEIGLDAWGSLSVETLLRARPEFLIISDYKLDTASLANAWYAHPAITELASQMPSTRLGARYWACGAPQSLDSVALLRAAIATRP